MRTILQAIRDRRESEEGFTLIELMVVVLIIAILIAIAIPTFLGARGRANDRAAQSSLRNGLTAAKTIFTDASAYPATVAAAVTAVQPVEPSLTFQAGASGGPKQVMINSSAANDILMSGQSASTKCYYITDSATFGTGFAVENGTCAAATAPAVLAATPAPGSTAAMSASGTAPTWASAW